MCGFTCVIKKNKKKIFIPKNSLNHRGPDYSRYLFKNKINFRHWRLSIVDLSRSSNQPIEKLISQSRFYISTYNATTYLESLFLNVPTIIFWNPEHWELNKEAKPYFKLLIDAGIFHKTPYSAAQKMIEVWNNVDGWWMSENVQNARQIFCEKYSFLFISFYECLSLFNENFGHFATSDQQISAKKLVLRIL